MWGHSEVQTATVVCELAQHPKRSGKHKEALNTYLGKPEKSIAPTREVFQSVLDDVRRNGRPTNIGPKKSRKCRWVLAEAKRRRHIRFLSKATTINLMADGRKSRLLVRF